MTTAHRTLLLVAAPMLALLAGPAATLEGQTMDENCRKDVIELHQFFEDWFSGKLEPSEKNFERFTATVAESFEIISPDGTRMVRDEILERVKNAHGANKDRGFRVWIKNYRGRPIQEGIHLATYEEWQEQDGKERGRLSTALFRTNPDAPNGVVWLHVHETWLPSER